MKAIINGKAYNTDTATEVDSYWNGYSSGDFHYVCETLYRTAKGKFFLHGIGGPMTPYARAYGNGYGGGEEIIPYTETEALEWCELRDCTDAIDAHFAHLVEEA